MQLLSTKTGQQQGLIKNWMKQVNFKCSRQILLRIIMEPPDPLSSLDEWQHTVHTSTSKDNQMNKTRNNVAFLLQQKKE